MDLTTIGARCAAELDGELRSTRELLARVPADKMDWAPHPKSMTLGALANHIATIPGWAHATLTADVLDFAEPREPRPVATTPHELVAMLEAQEAEAKELLAHATDDHLRQPWTLRNGETVYFTMSRSLVLRSWVMNHLYHHRGQLTVYLRLLDVPLPGVYGPTADTEM
jgi:uncharacterized damage-inducible protein DinB